MVGVGVVVTVGVTVDVVVMVGEFVNVFVTVGVCVEVPVTVLVGVAVGCTPEFRTTSAMALNPKASKVKSIVYNAGPMVILSCCLPVTALDPVPCCFVHRVVMSAPFVMVANLLWETMPTIQAEFVVVRTLQEMDEEPEFEFEQLNPVD